MMTAKQIIIKYLTEHERASHAELKAHFDALHIYNRKMDSSIQHMIKRGELFHSPHTRNRVYSLDKSICWHTNREQFTKHQGKSVGWFIPKRNRFDELLWGVRNVTTG